MSRFSSSPSSSPTTSRSQLSSLWWFSSATSTSRPSSSSASSSSSSSQQYSTTSTMMSCRSSKLFFSALLSTFALFAVMGNAFTAPFSSGSSPGGRFLRNLRVAMNTVTSSESKCSNRDAVAFSIDIQQIIQNGPIPIQEREFLIDGWRWHTQSALRDLARYSAVLKRVEATFNGEHNVTSRRRQQRDNDEKGDGEGGGQGDGYKGRLKSCYDFVCDYNLKALMKVEKDLFFPWLRGLLPSAATPLMDEMCFEQSEARELSVRIGELCNSLSGDFATEDLSKVREIGNKVHAIQKSYQKIQSVQESVFVPFLAAFIPRKEQERFNRKVIQNLGFIQSQIHLVGMIETIKEQPKEMQKLWSQVPAAIRATIPIWKRRIYDTKTACLII